MRGAGGSHYHCDANFLIHDGVRNAKMNIVLLMMSGFELPYPALTFHEINVLPTIM